MHIPRNVHTPTYVQLYSVQLSSNAYIVLIFSYLLKRGFLFMPSISAKMNHIVTHCYQLIDISVRLSIFIKDHSFETRTYMVGTGYTQVCRVTHNYRVISLSAFSNGAHVFRWVDSYATMPCTDNGCKILFIYR